MHSKTDNVHSSAEALRYPWDDHPGEDQVVDGAVRRALARLGVKGERREGRVGIWVAHEGGEDKIAAIGVRLKRWVSLHGIAINVEPDLSHFKAIVPCGITDERYGVTSLVDLGLPVTMTDVDVALKAAFEQVFGAIKPPGAAATEPRPAG